MSKQRTNEESLALLKKILPSIGFKGELYFEICSEACSEVVQACAEIAKIDTSNPKYGLAPKATLLGAKIRKQESVAITFAAMCLEACIWDYAACSTGQKKAKQNFESLNLVAKWVIIPQLLCRSDITKKKIGGTSLLVRLRELIKARNELVHAKSKPLPNNFADAIEALWSEGKRKRKRIIAIDAFGLIGLLLRELKEVDESEWWFFQTDTYTHMAERFEQFS